MHQQHTNNNKLPAFGLLYKYETSETRQKFVVLKIHIFSSCTGYCKHKIQNQKIIITSTQL